MVENMLYRDGERGINSFDFQFSKVKTLLSLPNGLFEFPVQLKLGDVVRNATVFNVATVKHESTCACLTGRNLFSTQDTELVEPKDTR